MEINKTLSFSMKKLIFISTFCLFSLGSKCQTRYSFELGGSLSIPLQWQQETVLAFQYNKSPVVFLSPSIGVYHQLGKKYSMGFQAQYIQEGFNFSDFSNLKGTIHTLYLHNMHQFYISKYTKFEASLGLGFAANYDRNGWNYGHSDIRKIYEMNKLHGVFNLAMIVQPKMSPIYYKASIGLTSPIFNGRLGLSQSNNFNISPYSSSNFNSQISIGYALQNRPNRTDTSKRKHSWNLELGANLAYGMGTLPANLIGKGSFSPLVGPDFRLGMYWKIAPQLSLGWGVGYMWGGFEFKGTKSDTTIDNYVRYINGKTIKVSDTTLRFNREEKIHAHLAQLAIKLKQDLGKRLSFDLALGLNIYLAHIQMGYYIESKNGIYQALEGVDNSGIMIDYFSIYSALNIQFHTNSRLYYKGGISYIGPYLNEGYSIGSNGRSNPNSTLSKINLNLGLGWRFKK